MEIFFSPKKPRKLVRRSQRRKKKKFFFGVGPTMEFHTGPIGGPAFRDFAKFRGQKPENWVKMTKIGKKGRFCGCWRDFQRKRPADILVRKSFAVHLGKKSASDLACSKTVGTSTDFVPRQWESQWVATGGSLPPRLRKNHENRPKKRKNFDFFFGQEPSKWGF